MSSLDATDVMVDDFIRLLQEQITISMAGNEQKIPVFAFLRKASDAFYVPLHGKPSNAPQSAPLNAPQVTLPRGPGRPRKYVTSRASQPIMLSRENWFHYAEHLKRRAEKAENIALQILAYKEGGEASQALHGAISKDEIANKINEWAECVGSLHQSVDVTDDMEAGLKSEARRAFTAALPEVLSRYETIMRSSRILHQRLSPPAQVRT